MFGRLPLPLLLAATLSAQVAWQPFPLYSEARGLFSYGFVYDEVRARCVLFGGWSAAIPRNETWEWDGAAWQLRVLPNSPPPMLIEAMVYDPSRAVVVLLDSTMVPWEFDGTTWVQRTPTTLPSQRNLVSCAYDRARGRTVVFGGRGVNSSLYFQETWEWDGVQWTQMASTVLPPGRTRAVMAFDPVRLRMMLLGGASAGPPLSDQWEWDGANWASVPIVPPAGFTFGTYATTHLQRNRVLLFDHTLLPASGPARHWEWDGSSWTAFLSPQAPPPPSELRGPLPWDAVRNRVVYFRGKDLHALGPLTEVGEWDTSTWSWIGVQQPPRPAARFGHGFAYFPPSQATVMFGGSFNVQFTDTWSWGANGWAQLQPSATPSPRDTTCMVLHPSRNEIVLFGGRGANSVMLGDTWVWDGVTWTQRNPATSPAARYWHSMACDRLRDRVVLFAGQVNQVDTDQTFEWDGVNWTQRTFAVRPPARSLAGLAFDLARGRTVLSGGMARNDTWEYDGVAWVQRLPANPPPIGYAYLAYDTARRRTVWFGDDVMAREWDGTDWLPRSATPAPLRRSQGGFAYDEGRRRLVLFGGFSYAGISDDIWEYGPTTPAQWSTFGAGCAGTLGTLTISQVQGSLPWLGTTFELRIAAVPAGQGAFVSLGSDTLWGTVPLPSPLGAFGMPNCTLLAGGIALLFLPEVGGGALLNLALPNTPAALGAVIHLQAAVIDPGANAAGLALSAGGTMLVGGR